MRKGTELPTFDNEHILGKHHTIWYNVYPPLPAKRLAVELFAIKTRRDSRMQKGPKREVILKVQDNVHVISCMWFK